MGRYLTSFPDGYFWEVDSSLSYQIYLKVLPNSSDADDGPYPSNNQSLLLSGPDS